MINKTIIIERSSATVVEVARGAVGPVGPQGESGLPGAAGAPGAKGDPGDTGPQGLTGTTGLQGVQGPAGVDGADGANGTNGSDGADGAQGIQGIQGVQGTPGTNGTNGAPGAKGDTGDIGPTGAAGIAPGLSPKTAGNYLLPMAGSAGVTGTLNYATGVVHGMPILVSKAISIDGIAVYVATAETGIQTRLSLYASDTDGHPATLTATGTVTTGAGAGVIVATFAAQTIQPGLYWVFLRTNAGNTIRFRAFQVQSLMFTTGAGTFDGQRGSLPLADPGTYAAPAATITAWTYSASAGVSAIPSTALRKA